MTRDIEKAVFTSKACPLASQVTELLAESVGVRQHPQQGKREFRIT